jgi:hypothetical protein
MSIYQCVRSLSRYGPEADIVPSSGQSINWSEAPTKGEVSDLLGKRSATGQLNIMADGNDNYGGGILEKNGDKYSVRPELAEIIGEIHTCLPRRADPDKLERTRSVDLSDF